ncbi:radical SAM protein [Halobacteriovorax sp. GB3]|uniref:radical SAM protein n=1 Tax=Halobacteriovorax sp. GB3 TaxID=2719615 RepID=UPI00235E3B5D|nr:radical SAM protein [Halobacteriovorax sp. GB3]MDD0854368.1 radical SAM protein [Halobacteriovorax sp. GB3]
MFAKDLTERIEIDLTGTCNARCPLCARNYKHITVKYNERSVSEIAAQLEEYPNGKYVHLVGAFSEPTLYKKFHDLCRYLVEKEWHIEICTNGDTHDEKWWSELGEILTERDSVYFTICGSTQELHEIYRVGTSLENIRKNAKAFRESCKSKIDYIQHILFDYNAEDLESESMAEIMDEFSHINLTQTLYRRETEIYKNPFNLDKMLVTPELKNKYDLIIREANRKWAEKLTGKKNYDIDCRSFNKKSIHIDQHGKVYPCYIWLEESRKNIWDGDYKKIQNFEYECCRICEKNCKRLMDMWDLEIL